MDFDLHVPTNDGHWVSEKFQRLAEVVKDYHPSLELRWIPPNQRTSPEDHKAAFAIVDCTHSVQGALVMTASATATPEEILKKLFLGDTTKHDVLAEIEAHNAAVKMLEYKKQMDLMEEANNKARFLIDSKLNTVKIHNHAGELITMDHERRRIK
jgi:hypothetical protein